MSEVRRLVGLGVHTTDDIPIPHQTVSAARIEPPSGLVGGRLACGLGK